MKKAAVLGAGAAIYPASPYEASSISAAHQGLKAGIIGLDTSHSVAFARVLNNPEGSDDLSGVNVVAAYPHGSRDIETSVSRIPGYTQEMESLGVAIVDSIDALLERVDVVLLETNDGRRHLEQALPVFKAEKPVFIDKPIAASLSDTLALYDAAEQYDVPLFSASSLRYTASVQTVRQGKIGKVLGADAYSPAYLETTHPDLFWYGVHGVELLFTAMGLGCQQVTRTQTQDTELVVGTWADGRIGTFRGLRSGEPGYGGIAFGEKGTAPLGPYNGYEPLLKEIVAFFRSGQPPVSAEETIEIFAFMEAADESKRQGGAAVRLDNVLASARQAQK